MNTNEGYVCKDFIRPYDNDPNFKYIPFRAAITLQRNKSSLIHEPFSDYALSFYKKYDPESYDIAVEWNKQFTQREIKSFNSFVDDMRKSKNK